MPMITIIVRSKKGPHDSLIDASSARMFADQRLLLLG